MRRSHLLGYSLVGLLAAVLVGQGVAGAQNTPPGPEPGAVGAAKTVNLSIPESMQAAETGVNRMETIRDGISRDLEQAREQRDVVKTLCLDDKLNQIDVALRGAADRAKSLKSAASRGDQELAKHEYTILAVMFQRGEQLDAEAKQCIGKEVGFVGDSSTSVDVDPSIAGEEAVDFPDPGVILNPPFAGSASK